MVCSLGLLCCARVIFHALGLLACRFGEASHPGPASSFGPASADPWATYLEEKSRQSSHPVGKPSLKSPPRSKWIDCALDLTQLDFSALPSALNMLSMLTRALFCGVHRVRSKHALLVVLPGGKNDDLAQFGFSPSAYSVHWMFVKDPLQAVWTRKLCTFVQMGANPMLPFKLDDAPEWDTSSYLEFFVHLSRRLFASDDAWQSFLATSRSQVPLQLRALRSSFNTSNVEFYSWMKLDNHAQRVTFRAPVAQKDLLLAASGVLVPFLITLVCRNDAARASRDSTSSVVWLGKRGYSEALTLIKQLEGHLGLAMSKESFGFRCASTSLDAVRRWVSPADSKYCDSNIKIKGAKRFAISGLPMGCSRAEIIKRFAEWKHGSTIGWAIIPVKHWATAGQSHWLVKADTDPLAHFYNCKECRVLIQPEVVYRPAPKSRASSRPPVPKKPEASSTSVALARVVAVEGLTLWKLAPQALRLSFSRVLLRSWIAWTIVLLDVVLLHPTLVKRHRRN